jgi:UDP-N-acetylmuramoylalanine--D-glutamate ligase
VRHAILIGEDAPAIAAALESERVPVSRQASLADAVTEARTLAGPGDVVLLSPACASFDMFDNFEHRGDAFRTLVQGLA